MKLTICSAVVDGSNRLTFSCFTSGISTAIRSQSAPVPKASVGVELNDKMLLFFYMSFFFDEFRNDDTGDDIVDGKSLSFIESASISFLWVAISSWIFGKSGEVQDIQLIFSIEY